MEGTDERVFISVAAPAHNEIEALPDLHKRISSAMDELGRSWELVLVDDGSTDGTREYLRGLAQTDPRVKVVLLSRNFGHTPAYMAALEHSNGEWTALMDADLQDPPELIPQMLELAEEGNEVVYAIRGKRPEGVLMRLAFRAFYRLAGRVSTVPQPANAGPFSLMARRVVREIVELPERGLFFPGVRAFVGFRQTGITVDRGERLGGKSRIGLRRRISGALDGIFAFSTTPLRIAVWLGVSVAALTGLLELFFLYFKLFTDVPIEGFTALITAILLLGGIQLLTIGIIGEYLGRVFDEVKRRPRYVVEERINVAAQESESNLEARPE